MTNDDSQLTPDDLRALAERGIDRSEAERQLALLRDPPPRLRLLRPCTLGDGIEEIPPARHAELNALWAEAAESDRITKFVPASGAATRMFHDLSADSPERPKAQRRLFESRERFAFSRELSAAVVAAAGDRHDHAAWSDALLGDEGLRYASLPKALLAFHRYGDGSRTAFEEQLVEAAGIAGESGPIRLHFTVSAEHLSLFKETLLAVKARLDDGLSSRFQVGFSTQSPATDTVCVDSSSNPFHTARGELLLRPAGHGALLGNLEALGGDLVVIKNIDNIQPVSRQPEVLHWKRLLVGLLIERRRSLKELERGIDRGEVDGEQAARQLARTLDLEPAADLGEDELLAWARACLDRPLRVCGMVRNEGEPGGGPFWVADSREDSTTSTSRQIVESSQVDFDLPSQAAIWSRATHFNPVDLVCAMRRAYGSAYALADYVDPATAFVSSKNHEGRPLRSLERPGLWNGSMARWNTIFVEVPGSTFAPVKTVFDLLRPEHQPATA